MKLLVNTLSEYTLRQLRLGRRKILTRIPTLPFDIEWLPGEAQFFHGPQKRMRETLLKHSQTGQKRFSQKQVIDYILKNHSLYVSNIEKIKFYRIIDKATKDPLHFILIWCNYSIEAREELFAQSDQITTVTGWYPLITGHRVFHHQRQLIDLIDIGLKKAMNKSDIEKFPGIGKLMKIVNFSKGNGTSILLKTTTSDLVLDAGLPEDELRFDELQPMAQKWLFISHSHKDHTGGIIQFLKNKKYVIAINPVSIELFLNAITNFENLDDYLSLNFFNRLAPMWYRSEYRFNDGSSIETIPTYHFPGSTGYLFKFSDGETLFYSGDLNVSVSYLNTNPGFVEENGSSFDLGRQFVDYGIIEASFVGRKIKSNNGNVEDLIHTIEKSIIKGRNHLLLTPPSVMSNM